MRVPDVVFKAIVFIGEMAGVDESGLAYGDFHGTGFLVSVPSRIFPQTRFVYVVTAKHVVEELNDKDTYMVVNSQDGSITHLKNIGPQWWFHPTDKSADVAIRQVGLQKDVAHLAIPTQHFITAEEIKAGELVVAGDEVFMAGLFSPASGAKRLMPIVRHGNIAMLPDEQIQTEYGFADIHLVEARSIGGLSGSPVFVRPPLRYGIEMPKGTTAYFDAIGTFRLLGLMHGHWDIRESEINNPEIEHDRKRGVNLGIGIVVPATKILETINRSELAEFRRLGEEDLAKKNKAIPGTDSAKPKTSDDRTDFTKDDFESALKKASRKIPTAN